jgi:hypothetical protein
MNEEHPPYRPLASLVEARAVSDGVVILEGDWGGQIYLVAQAARVVADEAALERLLRDLDAIAWPANDAGGARVRYERLPAGATVPGGMGGGVVAEAGGLWVHPELAARAAAIDEVLSGRRAAMGV